MAFDGITIANIAQQLYNSTTLLPKYSTIPLHIFFHCNICDNSSVIRFRFLSLH